jgi:hypothetical protein
MDVLVGRDLIRALDAVIWASRNEVFLKPNQETPLQLNHIHGSMGPQAGPTKEEVGQFAESIRREYSALSKAKTDAIRLPPFREIQHTFSILDETKRYEHVVYPVPDKFRDAFKERYTDLGATGVWIPVASANASSAMVIGKKETWRHQSCCQLEGTQFKHGPLNHADAKDRVHSQSSSWEELQIELRRGECVRTDQRTRSTRLQSMESFRVLSPCKET